MENEEIKIRSYRYMLQNLLIVFAILSVIVFAIGMIFCCDAYRWIFVSVMVPMIGGWLIGAVVTRSGCRTYDLYSQSGIKRIRGDRVLCSIEWENVRSAVYYSMGEILVLSPFVLNIDLKKPLQSNEDRSYDDRYTISTPMGKKTVKRIAAIMPIAIKNMPKSRK